jgi:cytochrome oxidase assembly protein ShyY1
MRQPSKGTGRSNRYPTYCLWVLAILRQRRYLGLFGLAGVVAILCVLAGSWQVIRFDEKHAANHELRRNNKDAVVDIVTALGPVTAQTSTGRDQEFRHVTATGRYLADRQTLLRGQTVGSDVGYVVLTPLKTDHGVLLIARGFIVQTGTAKSTPSVLAPPDGQVSVTARLEPADTRADRYGALPANQVETINVAAQAQRIGSPVWNGYAELLDNQPGGQGLTTIPAPDLSNPAGGAVEPQHAAYVVQWFLFAGLALAAPFVLANAERRRDRGDDDKPSLDDRLAGRA